MNTLEQRAAPVVQIPAGMKAWHGGDKAPADWNPAGDMLFRDGTPCPSDEGEPFWDHTWGDADVIAYTPTLDSMPTSQGEGATIPEGMAPWIGRESAPTDWDGRGFCHRDGAVYFGADAAAWAEKVGERLWSCDDAPGDIVAYTSTTADEARYLIRKGGVFYRPNAQGYTASKAEAGRYTLADAIAYSHPNGPDGPRDGIDYMLADPLADAGKPIAGAAEPFLDQLRRVNLARYEAWVEGADAGIMFDALELGGEVGELLNVVKKLEREERGWRGSRSAPEDFADECADVLICLDKLARRRNVDLAAVTISKFNATSEKVGLPHRLEASLGSGAPAEQEIAVSVAERVEPCPVGDPEIIQVEDRAGSQREAEGVPRDHARENAELREALEGVIEHATSRIQDGIEMGGAIWRIALEDIVRDARAAVSAGNATS